MTTGAPYPYGPQQEGPHGGSSPGSTPPGPRRSRARTLIPLAIAAWTVLEIWLLMLVADAAGGLTVLAILVGGFLLGAFTIKRAGRRAWRKLSESLQQGAGPAPGSGAAADPGAGGGNALAMLGGLLLMIPGLVSDAGGLFCLFPPTAALLRRGAERMVMRGPMGQSVRQARSAGEQVRMHRPDGKVVPGEVISEDEPPQQGGERGERGER